MKRSNAVTRLACLAAAGLFPCLLDILSPQPGLWIASPGQTAKRFLFQSGAEIGPELREGLFFALADSLRTSEQAEPVSFSWEAGISCTYRGLPRSESKHWSQIVPVFPRENAALQDLPPGTGPPPLG